MHDDRPSKSQDDIRNWSRDRYEQFVSDGIFVITRIYNYWSSSTKTNNKNKQKTDRIDMDKWIWRESSLELRRRVTELDTSPSMCKFMYTDRDHKSDRQKYHRLYIHTS